MSAVISSSKRVSLSTGASEEEEEAVSCALSSKWLGEVFSKVCGETVSMTSIFCFAKILLRTS